MYRKFLLASVGALALTGSAALAADLPSRAPPPVYLPPVPIFTWTGIYIGGQIGYAWGNQSAATIHADLIRLVSGGIFTTKLSAAAPKG